MNKKETNQLAVFWGCLIPLRLPWIEVAARKVLPKLGFEIVDLSFSCCPDPIASKALDHKLWLSLAARNLTVAEKAGLDILTLCNGCFETLKMAQVELENPEIREDVNRILKKSNRNYQGNSKVYHFQEWLYETVGLNNLEQMVNHSINLKAAVHVGCHYTRPAEVMQTDNPVYPEQLDELCEVIGIESVEYPDKNLCCGVGVGLTDRKIATDLIERKINGLRAAGAEAIVAHCPSCIQSYDFGQFNLNRSKKLKQVVPVLHYLELLGLSMGMEINTFAFAEHRISILPAKIKQWFS